MSLVNDSGYVLLFHNFLVTLYRKFIKEMFLKRGGGGRKGTYSINAKVSYLPVTESSKSSLHRITTG